MRPGGVSPGVKLALEACNQGLQEACKAGAVLRLFCLFPATFVHRASFQARYRHITIACPPAVALRLGRFCSG